MEERDPDLQAAVEAALQDRFHEQEHLDAERLVAYHHDKLSAQEAETVQEHLANCRTCSDLLLDLVQFSEPLETDEVARDDREVREEEADWAALSTRLGNSVSGATSDRGAASGQQATSDQRGPGESLRATTPSRSPRARRSVLQSYALAASLLAMVGLGIWNVSLRNQLTAARQPQLNVQILNLEPAGSTRSSPEESTVSGPGRGFVVILNPTEPAEVDNYRLEVHDAQERLVWQDHGLEPEPAKNFHLTFPPDLFLPGKYQIHLFREETLIATFDFEVAP